MYLYYWVYNSVLKGILGRQRDPNDRSGVGFRNNHDNMTNEGETEIQNTTNWVIVNMFEELEGEESIEALSKGYPAQTLGPIFFGEFLQGEISFPKYIMRTSLWEENEERQSG